VDEVPQVQSMPKKVTTTLHIALETWAVLTSDHVESAWTYISTTGRVGRIETWMPGGKTDTIPEVQTPKFILG
jgi:hypothetical protein